MAPGLRQAINKASQAQGPQGEQGETGPQGATGPQGETGPAGALAATAIDLEMSQGDRVNVPHAGGFTFNLECGTNRIGSNAVTAGIDAERGFGTTAIFRDGTYIETEQVKSNDPGWLYATGYALNPQPGDEISGHFMATVTASNGQLSQVDLSYSRDHRNGKPDCIFHGSVTEIGTPFETN